MNKANRLNELGLRAGQGAKPGKTTDSALSRASPLWLSKKSTAKKPAPKNPAAKKPVMKKAVLKQSAAKTFASKKGVVRKPLPYQKMFYASLGNRIDVVKAGVDAGVVRILASDLQYEQGTLIDVLGFSRATVSRKIKAGQRLDVSASERVVGVMRLVGQVKHMVEESGDPKGFDASAWVGWWLEQPLPALGGKTAGEFMDSGPGQELVSQLLAQSQSGAYA